MSGMANTATAGTAAVVRWVARLLALLLLFFWGVLIVGHLTGSAGNQSRPLVWQDYLLIAMMLLSLVGLAVAWRWEFLGAALTLVAVAVGAAVNWRVLVFPGTLVPLTALLFLASGWLHHVVGKAGAALPPAGD